MDTAKTKAITRKKREGIIELARFPYHFCHCDRFFIGVLRLLGSRSVSGDTIGGISLDSGGGRGSRMRVLDIWHSLCQKG